MTHFPPSTQLPPAFLKVSKSPFASLTPTFMTLIPQSNKIITAQYAANDVAFLHFSNKKNYCTDMLNNEKWWIVINESKSVAVFFAEKNRIKPRNIIVNSHRVSWSNSDKYLGVVLYSKLTWIPHLKATVNKAMEAFIYLAPLFHNKSDAPLTKLRVFSAIIRSISTYILSSLSEDRPQHLQIIQGRFMSLLRSTLQNIPWYIRNDQIRHLIR